MADVDALVRRRARIADIGDRDQADATYDRLQADLARLGSEDQAEYRQKVRDAARGGD